MYRRDVAGCREGQGTYSGMLSYATWGLSVIDSSSQADPPLDLITERTHRQPSDWGADVERTTMVLRLVKVTYGSSLTPTHKICSRSRPNLCEAFEGGGAGA